MRAAYWIVGPVALGVLLGSAGQTTLRADENRQAGQGHRADLGQRAGESHRPAGPP